MKAITRIATGALVAALALCGVSRHAVAAAPVTGKAGHASPAQDDARVWQKTTRYWVRVRTPGGNWVESFDGLEGRRQACDFFVPPRRLGDWCYDPDAEQLEEVIDPRNGTMLRSHGAPAYRFAIYCARKAADIDLQRIAEGRVDEAVDPEQCGK